MKTKLPLLFLALASVLRAAMPIPANNLGSIQGVGLTTLALPRFLQVDDNGVLQVNGGGGGPTIAPNPANNLGSVQLVGYTTAGAPRFIQVDDNGIVQTSGGGGGGGVSTVSVVTANGFAGTVANATSTPAITLTTSVTGILKGNGTAISAATFGTDLPGLASSNSWTGSQTLVGPQNISYTSMPAVAVDFTKGGNVYTASGASATFTYSSTTAGTGTWLEIIAGVSDFTATIPTTWSVDNGANLSPSTLFVQAGKNAYYYIQNINGRTEIRGVPPVTTGTGAYVLANSPAMTGTPTAPTATIGTNTTQIATTAFVLANAPTSSFTNNPQSGTAYTLAIGDANNMVQMTNASANAVTVPPNSSVAFTSTPVTQIVIQRGPSAGVTTITAGAGVTINSPYGLTIPTANSIVTLLKTGTDTWQLSSGPAVVTASGKILTVNNTLTFAGTDGTTMTFPSTSASVARIDAAQSFSGTQQFNGNLWAGGLGSGAVADPGVPYYFKRTATTSGSGVTAAFITEYITSSLTNSNVGVGGLFDVYENGSATGGAGHVIAVIGRTQDTTSGARPLYGVEGKVVRSGDTTVTSAGFHGISDFWKATLTGTVNSVYDGFAENYLANGTTPNAQGTTVVFRAFAPTGGDPTLAYALTGEGAVGMQIKTNGAISSTNVGGTAGVTIRHDGTDGYFASTTGNIHIDSGGSGYVVTNSLGYAGADGFAMGISSLRANVYALTITSNGTVTQTPAARTTAAAALPYFAINTPADTAITASVEAPGVKLNTAIRQYATGALTLHREVLLAGPTIAFVGSSTLTDGFTVGITPVVQGTNATITRIHSLGILDSTSAASSITGGLIVATTFGTTATSVGIGGGNVNAGGLITGGTITSTGLFTASSTSTFTGATTHNNAVTINGAAATTALTLTQTARTSGSLPYIKWTIPTDTAQATTAESPGLQILTGTRQWTSGTVALQRENLFAAPTYSQTAAGTFTDANTFTISGAPISGTNASMTSTTALLIQAGAVNGAGTAPVNAYSLRILNPTGASGGNFAIQIGTAGTAFKNFRMGTSGAMTAGAVTVSDVNTTATTRFMFSTRTLGTITLPGSYYCSTRTAATSFVISSSSATDTSTVDWCAWEP